MVELVTILSSSGALPKPDCETASKSDSEKQMDYSRLIADFYNGSQGNRSECDCKKCNNRGFEIKINGDGFPIAYECECMRQRRYIRSMIACEMKDYRKYSFKSYKPEDEWQQAALDQAKRFSETTDDESWFFIGGQSGAGKSHLCIAICTFLVYGGREVVCKRWAELMPLLKRLKFKEEQEQVMEELRKADVLYIDDFMKTENRALPGTDDLDAAFRVVDMRYRQKKKTIISTEWLLSELIGFDEATAGRIVERTDGHIVQIGREEGRNYRMRGIR